MIFTSCGSEADNRAIDLALNQYYSIDGANNATPWIITSAVEHPAILVYLEKLQKDKKINLLIIDVDSSGTLDPSVIERNLRDDCALVTVMHSNNEVGTMQPIQAIANIVKIYNEENKTRILFHTDAAQSIGKVPVDVSTLGVDLLTVVGNNYCNFISIH